MRLQRAEPFSLSFLFSTHFLSLSFLICTLLTTFLLPPSSFSICAVFLRFHSLHLPSPRPHSPLLIFSPPFCPPPPSYSSGAVYVWDLSTDVGPVRVKQTPGPFLHSEPTCCDLQSNWTALGTRDGQSVAYSSSQNTPGVQNFKGQGKQ